MQAGRGPFTATIDVQIPHHSAVVYKCDPSHRGSACEVPAACSCFKSCSSRLKVILGFLMPCLPWSLPRSNTLGRRALSDELLLRVWEDDE
jgi:hypothetical protein